MRTRVTLTPRCPRVVGYACLLSLATACGGPTAEQQLILGEFRGFEPQITVVSAYTGDELTASVSTSSGGFALAVPAGSALVVEATDSSGRRLILSGSLGFTVCRVGAVHDFGVIEPRPSDCPDPELCRGTQNTLELCRSRVAARCDRLGTETETCRQTQCAIPNRRLAGCVRADMGPCEIEQQALQRCLIQSGCQDLQDTFLRECLGPCGFEAEQQRMACDRISEACRESVRGYLSSSPLPPSIGCQSMVDR